MRKLKTPPTPLPRLVYTLDEARALLRIGKPAITRLTKSGELHAVRVGRLVRVPAWAIEAYLGTPITSGSDDGDAA